MIYDLTNLASIVQVNFLVTSSDSNVPVTVKTVSKSSGQTIVSSALSVNIKEQDNNVIQAISSHGIHLSIAEYSDQNWFIAGWILSLLLTWIISYPSMDR